jgi:hypothetical protein
MVGPMRSLSLRCWHVNYATHSLSLVSMKEGVTRAYLPNKGHVQSFVLPPCGCLAIMLGSCLHPAFHSITSRSIYSFPDR